jgi:hypothetical protein
MQTEHAASGQTHGIAESTRKSPSRETTLIFWSISITWHYQMQCDIWQASLLSFLSLGFVDQLRTTKEGAGVADPETLDVIVQIQDWSLVEAWLMRRPSSGQRSAALVDAGSVDGSVEGSCIASLLQYPSS